MKNYIFEIENTSNTDEHIDIVGGPETDKLDTAIRIIKNTWRSPDDYWVVEIRARKKDHMKYNTKTTPIKGWIGKGGNKVGIAYIHGKTVEEAINSLRNLTISLFDWAADTLIENGYKIQNNEFSIKDNNMGTVYKLCDLFFARAYFTINKKSFNKTKEVFTKKTGNTHIDFMDPMFLSFALYGNGYPLYAYIDCDIDPESESKFGKKETGISEINRFINYLEEKNIRIYKVENSHNGVHIYTDAYNFYKVFKNPKQARETLNKLFDITCDVGELKGKRRFSNNRIGDESILEKGGQAAMLLYSPCGNRPQSNVLINKRENYPKLKGMRRNMRADVYDKFNKNDYNLDLTESVVRQLVNECLKKLLSEADINMRDRIGSKGPLTTKNLLNPNEIFATTLELIEKYKKLTKNVSFEEFFENDPGYLIWKNYVKSMTGIEKYEPMLMKNGKTKKDYKGNPIMIPVIKNIKNVKSRDEHGNVVLDKDGKPVFEKYPKIAIGFLRWIENMTTAKKVEEFGGIATKIYAYKYNNSYLFGYYNLGVFIANSFAGDDGGIAPLIQSICGYNNVVFAVSMDLAPMLVKIGLYTDGKVHTTTFGGEVVKKMTLTTNPDLIGITDSMDKKNQNNNQKNEVNVNLIKNKKLRNFLFSNLDIMDDIMNDDGVQKYVEEHPEQMEQMITKIVNDLVKEKHANKYKSKNK